MGALGLYKLASTLGLPLLAGGFYIRSLSQRAYRQRLGERLGWTSKNVKSGGVIIHGASIGEIIALQPFIEQILSRHPELPVTVTSFTPTGSQQIQQRFAERVQHCYLPMDNPISCKVFLKRLQPRILVLMETEIWPALIDQCRRQGVKLLLINGRISQRSFPRYQKIRSLVASSLEKIDAILAQSDEDAERFKKLGAPCKNVTVSGNIKYDLAIPKNLEDSAQEIMSKLDERILWVTGSSHEDEEDLIIQSFLQLREQHPNILLILAPRHPERVAAIEKQLHSENIDFIKRSDKQIPNDTHQVWLIDTMGELLLFYRIAEVCTIAGSFGATGGHNPLEAALFKKPIVVGSNMANFQEMNQQLLDAEGIVQLKTNTHSNLSQNIHRLISDEPRKIVLGDNAFTVLAKNQGALQQSLESFEQLM